LKVPPLVWCFCVLFFHFLVVFFLGWNFFQTSNFFYVEFVETEKMPLSLNYNCEYAIFRIFGLLGGFIVTAFL
jgi:hypothetical protein